MWSGGPYGSQEHLDWVRVQREPLLHLVVSALMQGLAPLALREREGGGGVGDTGDQPGGVGGQIVLDG
jgi:hypothetical protein